MAVELTVELCNDARNIRRTGAVFQKNILNLRKILARTKPTQVGEVGTGLFDIAARVPCKKLIFLFRAFIDACS